MAAPEADEFCSACQLRRQATWFALTSGFAPESASTRFKINFWLQHVHVQRFLVVLLVFDMFFVLSQGVLDSQYSESLISDYDAYVKACPPAPAHTAHLRRLALGVGAAGARGSMGGAVTAGGQFQRSDTLPVADHATLTAVLTTKRRLGGDSHVDCAHPHFGNHALHEAELVLAYCSIAILSMFLVENLLHLAMQPAAFCRHLMHVTDLVVVVLSLSLEFLSISKTFRHAVWGGLLIMVRIWRFARIGHGVLVADARRRDKDDKPKTQAGAHDRPSTTKVVPVQTQEAEQKGNDCEDC